MAIVGQINPQAEAVNRARDDLRRLMLNGGVSKDEIEKNLSVMERFIDACIDWKINRTK